jgi:PAS domain S-box-containing protein
MEALFRRSGLDVLGDMPWATHLCQFYQTKQDLVDILVPFIKAGLASNEYCAWVTSQALETEEAITALRAAIPDVDDFLESEQLEVFPYTEWYVKDGPFNAGKVLDSWLQKVQRALSRGYEGARVTGDTMWLERKDWKDFMAYESAINDVIQGQKLIVLCTYCLDRCGASEVIDVINKHKCALVRREGKWEIIESDEQKRTTEALRQSEARYRTIFNNTTDAIFLTDPLDRGRVLSANPAACRMLGYSEEECVTLMGLDMFDMSDPNLSALLEQRDREDQATSVVTFRRKDGSYFQGEVSWALFGYAGVRRQAVMIVRDITDRRKAEEELRKAHDELERRVLERTEQLEMAYRKIEDEIIERRQAEAALRDTNTLLKLYTIKTSKREYLDSVVKLIQEWTGCEAVGLRVLDKEANIAYQAYTGFSDDFRASEDCISSRHDKCICPRVVAGVPDPLEAEFITSGGSFHCEDSGAFISDLPADATSKFRGKCMASDYSSLSIIPISYEDKILGAIHIADRAKAKIPRKMVEFIESIQPLVGEALHRLNLEQERQSLELQLHRSQKLEALGTLAGGIAHDFNNVLAAIIGFTELTKDRVTEGSREWKYATRVLEAGIRGRELVKQMLAFSRQTEQEKKPLQLRSIIKESVKFLRASLPTTIGIRLNVKSESGLVMADPVQIQQVLMNLATNGAYAMREKGGVLEIELSDFSVAAADGNHDGIGPGLYMKILIRDTGEGIPADVIEKIFDPFFTTKKVGEGTGLGLSVVMGIIKQSNGYVTVESRPGSGSVFCIYLPKLMETPLPDDVARDEMVPTGHERVLFVDDEEALVEVGSELLGELGYEVVAKSNSREALAVFRLDPSAFDLVITDQTMPYLTGLQLAREIGGIRSDIPVILCTGFSHLVDAEKAKAAGVRAFAMKPLTKREISKTIRKVLDESQ